MGTIIKQPELELILYKMPQCRIKKLNRDFQSKDRFLKSISNEISGFENTISLCQSLKSSQLTVGNNQIEDFKRKF